MKHVRPIALAVIALVGVGLVAIASAQDGRSANVEIRVWQSTSDSERLWISARPEGGSWETLGTVPLDMSGLNGRGTLRYEDITLAVPLSDSMAPVGQPTQEPVRAGLATIEFDFSKEPRSFLPNELRWCAKASTDISQHNMFLVINFDDGRSVTSRNDDWNDDPAGFCVSGFNVGDFVGQGFFARDISSIAVETLESASPDGVFVHVWDCQKAVINDWFEQGFICTSGDTVLRSTTLVAEANLTLNKIRIHSDFDRIFFRGWFQSTNGSPGIGTLSSTPSLPLEQGGSWIITNGITRQMACFAETDPTPYEEYNCFAW